jgi:hypothetical protein
MSHSGDTIKMERMVELGHGSANGPKSFANRRSTIFLIAKKRQGQFSLSYGLD